MSNSSNDVKSSKPTFSYARAAQGSNAPTPTATSPQMNGRTASNTPSDAPETATSNGTNQTGHEQVDAAVVASGGNDRSNDSSVSGQQAAWTNKGSGVHMPPRSTPNTTSAVQFGNFTDDSESPLQQTPVAPKTKPAASGGIAPPPALRGKDVPQFGSVPAPALDAKLPTHSRSNSNASEFRPTTMSPNPSYPMGFQNATPVHYNQFSPAMPNNYRGRGGAGGLNQFQNRAGGRNMPGARNAPQSPMNSPQQQHVMGSPSMYQSYMGHQQMYPNYPGYQQQYGYNQAPNFPQQAMGQNYMNPQANRGAMGYQQPHQYQNPNLQAPTASSMSRSGSAASERPPIGLSTGTPASSISTPAYTPRKKGSSAIKIVDPNSKSEVVLPKAAPKPTPEITREIPSSPAPRSESPAIATPARPSSSASTTVPDTSEQRKAKQDAAKQAILDKIAAAKASEKDASDKKAADEKAVRDEEEAKAKAAKEADEAAEKARLAAEAARVEEERAAAAKAEEEKQAAEKQAEDARIAREAEETRKAEEAAKAEERAKAEASAAAAAAVEQEAAQAKEKAAQAKSQEQAETSTNTDESKTLDTIVEPVSAGQTEDVIETKAADREEGEISDSEEPSESATDEAKVAAAGKDKESSRPKASPMTTALSTSRRIVNLADVTYPSGISAPNKDINKNAKDGRFKYDKEFLLQFQKVFTDKPSFDWDDVIKGAMRDSDAKGKPGMGARAGNSRGGGSPFGLPSFNPKPLKSSDERFQQAEKMRAAGIDPKDALSGGGPSFERGSNFKPSPMRKDSSNAGAGRAESKKGGKPGRTASNRPEKPQIGAPTIAPEDVKPLANSGNRWTPKRAAESEPLPGVESTTMAPEVVQRKVKGLLNKLTLDNFDRITDQILEIASQSKTESDGRSLRQVIALTFEKATDEAHFSNMYARFCRKMMECTSDEVKDEGITDKHGKQVVGGALFRKYLLSRCQEDFERGWKTDLPPKPDGEPQNEEAAMLSDEYYIAAAAKRRGLGLVRFVGELFLLSMLNEKIMQECITKLLANVTNPEEEEVESLSKLVETVGSAMDSTERGRQVMDVYMARMAQLQNCDTLSSRIKFMVLDVLDLRRAGWVGGKADKGPKTIQQIHDDAAAAALLKEAQRGPSHRGGMGGGGGRPDFGRGDARNLSRRQEGPVLTTGPDGWQTLKQPARDTRAGDLTKFGKFAEKRSASQQSSFGPGGNLSQATRTNSNLASRNPSHTAQSREDSRSAQAPSNPFAALEGNSGDPSESQQEETPAAEDSSSRPRLNLLPKGATDGKEAVHEPKTEAGDESSAAGQTQDAEESEVIPMPGDE